jgi:hypothetical protein
VKGRCRKCAFSCLEIAHGGLAWYTKKFVNSGSHSVPNRSNAALPRIGSLPLFLLVVFGVGFLLGGQVSSLLVLVVWGFGEVAVLPVEQPYHLRYVGDDE